MWCWTKRGSSIDTRTVFTEGFCSFLSQAVTHFSFLWELKQILPLPSSKNSSSPLDLTLPPPPPSARPFLLLEKTAMAFVFLKRKQSRPPPFFFFLTPISSLFSEQVEMEPFLPGVRRWGEGGCRGHKSSGKPQRFHSGVGQEGSTGGSEGFKLRKTRTLLCGGEAAGGLWGVKEGGGAQKVPGHRSRIPGWWLLRVYLEGTYECTAAAAHWGPTPSQTSASSAVNTDWIWINNVMQQF